MINKRYLRYYAPLLFFLVMLVDGQIARVTNSYFEHTIYFHSYLLILLIIFSTTYFSKTYLVVLTIVIGIMMDSYYIGIIGLYALGLPLVTLMAYFIFKHVNTNLWTKAMADIIFVTFLETGLLLVHVAFSFVTFHPIIFVTRTLGPTILLNLFLFVLLSLPLKKLFS